MDLLPFFQPLEDVETLTHGLYAYHLGKSIPIYVTDFPDWEKADLILIGCSESRGNLRRSESLHAAPQAIRQQLYNLTSPVDSLKLCDLGDLIIKDDPEDTYQALAYVLEVLIKHKKTVIIMGGSEDIAYGQFMAYENLEQDIEYVHIDARLDMKDSDIILDNQSYNHKIFLHKPDYLFSYTNLGYQRYFVPAEELSALKDLNFSAIRYGELNEDISEAEPYLRTANMASVDFSAMRFMDAPGGSVVSPSGFSALEASRLARYAGLAYQLNTISFCELDTEIDTRGQTALLGAVMIWYFIEGFYNRKDDLPKPDRKNLRKYAVKLRASIEEITFYLHPATNRWWMEVPHQENLGGNGTEPPFLVACSKKDYETAKSDHIPDRWWLTYNKLR